MFLPRSSCPLHLYWHRSCHTLPADSRCLFQSFLGVFPSVSFSLPRHLSPSFFLNLCSSTLLTGPVCTLSVLGLSTWWSAGQHNVPPQPFMPHQIGPFPSRILSLMAWSPRTNDQFNKDQPPWLYNPIHILPTCPTPSFHTHIHIGTRTMIHLFYSTTSHQPCERLSPVMQSWNLMLFFTRLHFQ